MSGVELTERGRSSVLIFSIVILFAVLFFDFVILAASILIGAIFIYDYWKVRYTLDRAESLVEIEPGGVEASLTAGEMFTKELKITNPSGLSIDLTLPMDNAFLTSLGLDGNTTFMDLVFTPDLAGEYRLKNIETEFEGSLGLMRGSCEVPFQLSFDVQPRVLAAAIRVAKFLAGTQDLGRSDQPIKLKGAGLEYASSREYQPGDELHHIDWKATARLNRPIVKEFYMEGGGGIHLIYDARAPDPVSRDKLSASFLNATLAIARKGLPVGLTVRDGDRLILNKRRIDPREAVALALRYSLETSDVEVEEFYSVLEPSTTHEVRGLMEMLGEDSSKLPPSKEARNKPKNKARSEMTMKKIIESSEGNLQIGIVSSLSGDISQFLELEDIARQKGCRLSILQPTEPWKQAKGLEESYRINEKYSKARRVFQKKEISFDSTLENFLRTLSYGKMK